MQMTVISASGFAHFVLPSLPTMSLTRTTIAFDHCSFVAVWSTEVAKRNYSISMSDLQRLARSPGCEEGGAADPPPAAKPPGAAGKEYDGSARTTATAPIRL